jgi:hypothetical protein
MGAKETFALVNKIENSGEHLHKSFLNTLYETERKLCGDAFALNKMENCILI